MGRDEVLTILRAHYDELREKFGVQSLRLFGSVARGEGRTGSDIDVLVDFGGPAGFNQYMDLLFHLEDLLGERVDLVTFGVFEKNSGPTSSARQSVSRDYVLFLNDIEDA